MIEKDWIDKVKVDRDAGINKPLSQSQHAAVNARYEGCTLEHCCDCWEPTGRAGAGEDSLFSDEGDGPYCVDCWEGLHDDETPEKQQECEPQHPDACSECGQKVAGWEPVFGSFAPEWWETQRENGIDPQTGHKQACSKKVKK